ncbi:MAG: MBL fold metallo-hydrolase [Hyphomicrobiaceae bacterium]
MAQQDLPLRAEMNFVYGEPRQLYPGVRRIVANNPSPFTYKGTNTYIVGDGDSLMLIDPGPADPAHLSAILAAIGPRKLSHIVITHTHRDHTDGLAGLLAATAGASTVGFGRRAAVTGAPVRSASGSEYFDADFVPDIPLTDGQRIEGDGFALTALHTPGHAPDHLCLALEGTGILFSGDHVMGWNTSVVAPPEGRMGDYIRSLEKLLERADDTVYLPGHGGQIEQPLRVTKAFLVHRRMREQAILDCIRDGKATVNDIVPVIYKGLDPRLVNAASLSVLAHVEHLVERGLVACAAHPPTRDGVLSAV